MQQSISGIVKEQKVTCCALQGLYKQMVESFRSLGVEATPGVGHPFDPRFHDAIMQEPNDDVPDGTVLAEFRKGFKLGDKLLRAAMVKVSSSPTMHGAHVLQLHHIQHANFRHHLQVLPAAA